MRFLFVRCLVVLLALALIGGNVHARLQVVPTKQTTAPVHHHDHAAGAPSHRDNPSHDKGLRCCCDFLGCVSAYTVTPDFGGVVPVTFGTAVRYLSRAAFLHGRALLPEPEPPRPSTLI